MDESHPKSSVEPRPQTEAARSGQSGLAALNRARESAEQYELSARSPATWRAYRSDWHIFERWCRTVGLVALPATPETVRLFLSAEADRGRAPSTLRRRIAAIRLVHLGADELPPHQALEVTEVMRGIRRTLKRPVVKKAAALDADVRAMVDATDPSRTAGLRDRALLLIGFAGAFRRSELAGINVEHLERHPKGLLVTVPSSKGDQEGEGQSVAILARPESRFCPVAALDRWLAHANIGSSALFRKVSRRGTVGTASLHPSSIAEIVKKAVTRVEGLDAANYSAHSLRRGLLTSAARDGADIFRLRAHARHRGLETVLGYVEDGERFDRHVARRLLSNDPEQSVRRKPD